MRNDTDFTVSDELAYETLCLKLIVSPEPNGPSDICRDDSHRTQRREAELGGIGGDRVITQLRSNYDGGIQNLKYTAKT